MLVKDVMTTDVVCLNPQMTFLEAAHILFDHKFSGAPVVENGKLVGILSEKDLFRALYPSYKNFYANPTSYLRETELEDTALEAKDKKIEEVMSRRVISTTPDTHILKIGGLMVATGIHRVPVMDGGVVVGMVSRGSIYRAIMSLTFSHLK
ncbi:MAG TPA: CBS domain-containing protein [Patescibacteria group bacterium]|nr:CBS domain-containing protein [Patescibacteria group bacterium]